MILIASLAAVGAGLASVAGGYLFGARRGRDARHAIAQERDALAKQQGALEQEVQLLTHQAKGAASAAAEAESLRAELRSLGTRLEAHDTTRVDGLREELRTLSRSVRDREREEQALRATLDARLHALSERATRPEELGKEVRRMIAPLLERESETRGLREMVQKAVLPLLEGERLGKELARLERDASGGLAGVLDAIARDGGFSAVVLSDDAGLPLAASAGTRDVETIAGSSSLVFTMADRAAREGRAPVTAMIMRHADGHLVLHRIFDVDGTALMLTAVARGRALAPEALDPALGSIERVLARRDAAA